MEPATLFPHRHTDDARTEELRALLAEAPDVPPEPGVGAAASYELV
jgi:hypothetical protein